MPQPYVRASLLFFFRLFISSSFNHWVNRLIQYAFSFAFVRVYKRYYFAPKIQWRLSSSIRCLFVIKTSTILYTFVVSPSIVFLFFHIFIGCCFCCWLCVLFLWEPIIVETREQTEWKKKQSENIYVLWFFDPM